MKDKEKVENKNKDEHHCTDDNNNINTHKLGFITVYLNPASAGLHEFRKDQESAQHHDKAGKDEYDKQLLVPLLVRLRFGELFEALLDTDLGLLHIVVDPIN